MAKQGAEHDQKDTEELHGGFQGQGGLGGFGWREELGELSQQFEIHPNQITTWKRQLGERAAEVFGKTGSSEQLVDVKAMHAKIGQLALENDFLEGALIKAGLLSAKR